MTELLSSSSGHSEEKEKVLLLLLNLYDKGNTSGYNCKGDRAWFIVRDTDQQFQCYKYLGDVRGKEYKTFDDGFRGIRSTAVGTSLFLIGGERMEYTWLADQDMCYFNTCNPNAGWKTFSLPFYTSQAQIITHHGFIYIFPQVYPFHYKGIDRVSLVNELPKNASQPYIYDSTKENGYHICALPSFPYGMRLSVYPRAYACDWGKDFFPGFRVCASWDERGLLVSIIGEEIFYLHDPLEDVWIPLPELEPLPKFSGKIPSSLDHAKPVEIPSVSTISNGTLYCCDLPDHLHVYDLKRGKLNFSQHLLLLSRCLEWRLLPTASDEILFIGYSHESFDAATRWTRTFYYVKFKVFKDFAEVVKKLSFKLPVDLRDVLDFMLIDPNQLQINSRDFEETSIKRPCIEASDKKVARVEFLKLAYHGAFDLGIIKSVPSCAYCCLVRRRCTDDCIFSPYFPSCDPEPFSIVHNVFGADKVEKTLQGLPVDQRADAVKSLIDEACSEFSKSFWRAERKVNATIEEIGKGEQSLPRYSVRGLNPAAQPFVPRRRRIQRIFSDHLVLGTQQEVFGFGLKSRNWMRSWL